MRSIPWTAVWLSALLLLTPAAEAQFGDILKNPDQGSSTSANQALPADPLGRATPRGTVVGFLREAQSGRYDLAAQYLEMNDSERDSKRGAETARELHAVMDFAYMGDLDRISNNPQGAPDARYPPNHEDAGGLRTEGGKGTRLVLLRVEDKDYGRLWLISTETLKRVPELYGEIGFPEIEAKLPDALVQKRILSIPLWRWIAAVAAAPLCAGIAWLLIQAFLLPARAKALYRKRHDRQRWLAAISTPLWVVVTMLLHYASVAMLRIPLLIRQYYTRLVWISLTLGFAWLLWRWIRMGLDKAYLSAIERGAASAGSLIRLAQAVLKVIMLAAVAFTCLGLLGFQLTPALAGLGLSGVVLAFAAQKTLENVFAGVSLLSDETIRVGDYCVIGTQKGTVESIGLRSTTLRTLDRTLLSIPNGPLAAMTIENFAYRDKISFNPTINLRYETTAEQMRSVLAGVWRMIEEDPRLETEGSRARFVRLGPSSLDVEIYAYVLTKDWAEFNAIREELLLRIMEIVDNAGTGFAFPSQTLYLSRDTPPKPQT